MKLDKVGLIFTKRAPKRALCSRTVSRRTLYQVDSLPIPAIIAPTVTKWRETDGLSNPCNTHHRLGNQPSDLPPLGSVTLMDTRFTKEYTEGLGYTVYDNRGRVLARRVSEDRADKILAHSWCAVLSSELLGLAPTNYSEVG